MSRNLGAVTVLDPSGPAWPVMGVLFLYRITDLKLAFLKEKFIMIVMILCKHLGIT
jgi:hypothetical protein